MLQFYCRTDSSVGKSVGTETRMSWVQIPLGPPSSTSKLSHRSSINMILLHSDNLFPKLYIIVSRQVRMAITPKCKSEGAEMSLRVVSGTWSPNWKAISPTMVLKGFHKTGKYNLATLSLYEFHCINCKNELYKLSRMLQFHCRTDSSVGKSVGTESRMSWIQVPLGPPSLTSKLSHRSSINIILLHSDKLFPKLYIIVSRRVRKTITPKCMSEGAEMSLRVVSGTWSPN